MKGINWVGVIAAAVVGYLVGFVWYGLAFAEPWMALTGVTPDAESGNAAMVLGFVNVLVVAIGLGWLSSATGKSGLVGGGTLGLLAAIFFAGTSLANDFIYLGENTGLIPIDGGYLLVSYVLMGITVGVVKMPAKAAA